MPATATLEETTQRYWKASMAWKNREGWAEGWTQGAFIAEVRSICESQHTVGWRADDLLDDVIYDKGHKPLVSPGDVIPLQSKTKIIGQVS